MCSFLYTASEPEYVITNGNGSIDNVTNQNGDSFIAGDVCDVEVRVHWSCTIYILYIIIHNIIYMYMYITNIGGKTITAGIILK